MLTYKTANRTMKTTVNFGYDIRGLSIENKNKIGGVVMDLLLDEYRESLRTVKLARKNAPKEESVVWSGMVASLSYAIEWLETGWQPGLEKTGHIGFRDENTFEEVGSVDYLNPFAPNAYKEVERKIDRERASAKRG